MRREYMALSIAYLFIYLRVFAVCVTCCHFLRRYDVGMMNEYRIDDKMY